MALYRQFATQEALDAEYDVERAVPDFAVYARHFVEQSRLARHRLRCELDVRYGPTRDEHLEIYPAGPGSPVLVFFHGGYWRMLSCREFSCVALGPVAAGITVVNVNYALAPKVTVDEIVRQARAAIAWTYAHVAEWGGDPRRIYASGHSAGGQLTAMAALTDWAGEYGLPPDLLKGGLPISGVFDLRPLPYCFVQPALQLTGEQVVRNSPHLVARRCGVPLTVAWGGAETAEFQRQSTDFLHAWQMADNPGQPLALAGANHFDVLYGLEQPDSTLMRAVTQMMRLPAARRGLSRVA